MRVLLEGCIDDRDRREFPPAAFTRHDSAGSARQENGVSCPPRGAAEVVDGLLMTWTAPPAAGISSAPVGEEADPAAVRRPEWILGAFGSGQLARVHVIHRSQPEHGLDPGIAALNTRAWPSGESANEGTLTVVFVRAENRLSRAERWGS